MKRIALYLFATFFVVGVSNAQLGGLMRKAQRQAERSLNKRMGEEVEKKVDEEVNKQIDKALDEAEAADTLTAEERDEAARVREQRIQNLAKSYGVGVEVPHKDSYVFSAKMDMLVEHISAKGKKSESVVYHSYFDKDVADYAIQFKDDNDEESFFIFDYENQCPLILTTDGEEKTGIATTISQEDLQYWVERAADEEVPNSQLKKTGRTKTIQGFKCEEHKGENEEGTVVMWITNDLKNQINRGMYKSKVFGGSFLMVDQTDGVLIQYDYKSKTTKEQDLMTVQKVNLGSSNTIDVSPYQIMGLNVPR